MDQKGRVLFTKQNIDAGQDVFLKYVLKEYGTLWGHGAYLGPDYIADYLHREAEIVQGVIAQSNFGNSDNDLTPIVLATVMSYLKRDLKFVSAEFRFGTNRLPDLVRRSVVRAKSLKKQKTYVLQTALSVRPSLPQHLPQGL